MAADMATSTEAGTPAQTGVMWELYLAELRAAEEEWQEGAVPPVIAAVAAATGLHPAGLWEEVEERGGWVTTDSGYQGMVWLIAWREKGFPDWQGVSPVPLTPEKAADDAWRLATGGD